jgi:heme A synthase
MSNSTAYLVVGVTLLLWLGVAIRARRRPSPAALLNQLMQVSGFTIGVAVGVGDAPLLLGTPLLLVGAALVVTGSVRSLRRRRPAPAERHEAA